VSNLYKLCFDQFLITHTISFCVCIKAKTYSVRFQINMFLVKNESTEVLFNSNNAAFTWREKCLLFLRFVLFPDFYHFVKEKIIPMYL